MNDDQSLFRKTCVWTAALLGASIVWVSVLSGASLLVVWKALPDASTTGATNPATPTPKPASSEPPSRGSPAREDAPTKRRNG